LQVTRFIGRKAAFVFSAVATLGVAAALSAMPASASTAPLPVTLSSSTGDGSSATCNANGDIVLSPGSDTSTTYAQADVNGVGAVPSIPPSFTTTNYAAGSPRWVIEFSNGNFITGYPVQMGTFAGVTPTAAFTGNQWGVGNGSSYTTYADALAGADVTGSVTVSDAFIIADGDQASGTQDVITDAQYDGLALSCQTVTATPTPTPSSSKSSSPTVPSGGVQTGGGKPIGSPWLPFALGLAIFGLLALTGGAVALRRQRG
jgi:hypothetical protein